MIASYTILRSAAEQGEITNWTVLVMVILIGVLAYVNSRLWHK